MATSRKRTSAVWKYFEEPVVVLEGDQCGKQVKTISCKLCNQQLTDGGRTTNLMSHLQAKHPKQYKRLNDSAGSSSLKQTTSIGVF